MIENVISPKVIPSNIMSNVVKNPRRALNRAGTVPNRRNSALSNILNTSSLAGRRYDEGSVYRQASRFNPYISSSTNISSSGSFELIISDLEGRIDSQPHRQIQFNEHHDQSDDQETAFINSIILKHKHLKRTFSQDTSLSSTIQTLRNLQFIKSIDKQNHSYQLRIQVLKAFNNIK